MSNSLVRQLTLSYGFDISLAEIERMYEIAVSGTNDEKISAATIFCGASLCRGWDIQVKLLDLYINFNAFTD